LSRPLFPQHRA